MARRDKSLEDSPNPDSPDQDPKAKKKFKLPPALIFPRRYLKPYPQHNSKWEDTPDALQAFIDLGTEYFNNCAEDKTPPGVYGLANHLGITYKSLKRYADRWPNTYGEVVETFHNWIAEFAEKNMWNTKTYAGANFTLRNIAPETYAEKQIIENHQISHGQISPALLAAINDPRLADYSIEEILKIAPKDPETPPFTVDP